MEGLYSGMSAGFGFLLFFALLSFIWILYQNFKKRMLPQNKPVDEANLLNHVIEEKREVKREDIVWPVFVEINKKNIITETKELSRGGAFVKLISPPAAGERLKLIIETPFRDTISLNSEVVWSNSNLPEERVVTRGMGVRFVQNSDRNMEMLKSALDKHLESENIFLKELPVKKKVFT